MISIEFKKREKLVSLFIISTLVILLTTFGLMGKFNKWFSAKNYYYTEFDKASGLKPGSTIIFRDNGWEIGSVYNVDINSLNNKVIVYFTVLKKYAEKIKDDSIVYLSKSGFAGFGSTNIEVSIGSKKSYVLRTNSFIPSTDSEEGKVMLEDKSLKIGLDIETNLAHITSNIDQLTTPGGPVRRILDNIDSITRQIKDGDGIGKIMDLIDDVNKSSKKIIFSVNTIMEHFKHLVESNIPRINKTIISLSDQVIKLSSKTGPMFENVDDSIKIVKKMLGDLSQIITDFTPMIKSLSKTLETNMSGSLKDIRGTVQNIRAITSRVHTLMDQIENLPFLKNEKKKKPLLRDQVEREDY
ncbi:MAG: MlaD family protein [Spirochaetota bacterium]|nr:MlaD family protein [Spirochaetota bacterium]